MSDRLRKKERIDYLQLHKVGKKVPKVTTFDQIREVEESSDESSEDTVSCHSGTDSSSDTVVLNDTFTESVSTLSEDLERFSFFEMSTDPDARKLSSTFEALRDDILDFIEENPTSEFLAIDDINVFVVKLEDQRSKYRNVYKEMSHVISNENYVTFGDEYQDTMKVIKESIADAKDLRNSIRSREIEIVNAERFNLNQKELEEKHKKESSKKFLFSEVTRLLKGIVVDISPNNVSSERNVVDDDELAEMRKHLPSLQQRIDDFFVKFKELINLVPDDNPVQQSQLTSLGLDADAMLESHVEYVKCLKEEIRTRELNKEKKFQSSSLQIIVPKFKGYDSPLDFYTFKDKFEQLHSADVPGRALPEFLKNNYLEGSALEAVKRLQTVEEIWESLKKAFGDPRVMLFNKLGELNSVGYIGKLRDSEKIKDGLNKVVNIMEDLMRLARDHNIEDKLYHGDGIYSIYQTLGDYKVTKFIEKNCDRELDGSELWEQLLKFLEKDIKIQTEKSMIYRAQTDKKSSKGNDVTSKAHLSDMSSVQSHEEKSSPSSNSLKKKEKMLCYLCGQDDHIPTPGPYGKKLIQYFSCKDFVESSCTQRFSKLKEKGYCTQCLFPGAKAATGKHVEGKCQNTYICKHESHNGHAMKKHVLVCGEHKDRDENKTLFEEYRTRCITRKCNSDLPEYSKTMQLSFHCSSYASHETSAEVDEDSGSGIYMFQQIKVNDETFNVFYDSGCGEAVMTVDAVQRLRDNAQKTFDGEVSLGGVGDATITSPHGACKISLPLCNGGNAVMSGLVLECITCEFPNYTLNTEVESSIQDSYKRSGGDVSKLPRLPPFVGGRVDIMVGVQYLRYFPAEMCRTHAGLTLYMSPFFNVDGSRGVVAGPHPSFRITNKNFFFQEHFPERKAFLTKAAQMSRIKDVSDNKYCLQSLQKQVEHDIEEETHDFIECSCALVSRNQRLFNEVENAGTEISYRCVKCRNCQGCKDGERIDTISIKEEVEQDVINNSVKVDLTTQTTTATLPFIENPVTHLQSNKREASLVFKSQLRRLNKDPQAKADVIASQNQLQELGFVDYIKNLSDYKRIKLFADALQYFIPWRAVWNYNSISTLCRLVFDATMPTRSGKALNNVIAKGENRMNKLIEIVLRWFIRKIGFHTDVKKMYNSVKLSEEHWCYQMYLWQDELDLEKEPEVKFIKTLIYGVKSSGNQAERGLRETARLQKEKYPRAYQVATSDIYVDDCASGENNLDLAYQTADELEIMLRNGGYKLKGFTFSGKPPPEHLSCDGKSINVTGMKWNSDEDTIQLDIGELNFGSKQRGKKPSTDEAKRIPLILTRKHCQAKVSEIFDIAGKITPITAGMKLDLHEFVDRGVQWKDKIPDDLRPIWTSHFEMMKEISSLRYNRTVIPEDAVSLDIETIDTGDASKSIACVAIYARLKRRSGEFSCQLVFARSKLIERGTTQPRAELIAAMLNAHTGEVVKRAFGSHHVGSTKLGDSQIVLHWINNEQKSLKQYVRSRVIEILRFTLRADWYYIESSLLIADLGTRKGAKIKDVDMNSDWINGYEWMRKEKSTFPITPVSGLVLSGIDKDNYQKELFIPYKREDNDWPQVHISEPGSFVFLSNRFNHSQIAARYEYSNYVIDPNSRHFSSVVRSLAIVKRFIYVCLSRVRAKKGIVPEIEYPRLKGVIMLSDEEIKDSQRYFFLKATKEVLHFAKETDYDKISVMKDEILYYSGRILPNQNINNVVTLTDTMKDLTSTTFFVPIIESHSPIAYSVVNEIHWLHSVANHRGVETVYRYVLQVCFILNGRNLVKMFRKNCERCRYLMKRTIEIEMGPVSGQNLTIAPAFYLTQVDIAGPFSAYSPHNKRSTVKIYYAVYCCSTTCSVNIKVMEDYSAPSFIQSFIRFSCETGYPKVLISDEGSQLVKGYSDMRIDFTDLKNKLHSQVGVDFEVVPIGGHNMTGKVERVISEVKRSIEKSYEKQRLSILQWETVGAEISNAINDMPLALGNVVSDFEEMDLITPNRLRLGRNNNRSPIAPLFVTNDPNKFFVENTQIFNTWFEAWLTSHVPKLMNQPKWYKTEYHLQEGDIVLFLKKEGLLNTTYQYGMVKEVEKGRDGKIRTVTVRYRNHNESVDRETRRAVRQLVMIHKVDELNIIQELGIIATAVDMKFKNSK